MQEMRPKDEQPFGGSKRSRRGKLTIYLQDRMQREQCMCGEPATFARSFDRKPFCAACARKAIREQTEDLNRANRR